LPKASFSLASDHNLLSNWIWDKGPWLYELYLQNIPVILLIHRHQSLVFYFWLVTHELSLVPLSTKLTVGLLSHFRLWSHFNSPSGDQVGFRSRRQYKLHSRIFYVLLCNFGVGRRSEFWRKFYSNRRDGKTENLFLDTVGGPDRT